eukprot:6483498-Amphidinium_carterae.1
MFLEFVAPTFSNTFSREDIVAVLKRANIVIFGRHHVYVRPAGIVELPVLALGYPASTGRDLINDAKKGNLKLYRSGSQDWMITPGDRKASLDFVRTHCNRDITAEEQAPPPGFGFSNILRAALPPGTVGTSSQMEFRASTPPEVTVKTEAHKRAFSRSLASSSHIGVIDIDLESPPDKRSKNSASFDRELLDEVLTHGVDSNHEIEVEADLAAMRGATPEE